MTSFQTYIDNKSCFFELRSYKECESYFEQYGGNTNSFNRVYVLDTLTNVIERIPYSDYNETTHRIVDDKLLQKLSKKNDTKIRRTISGQKNFKNKFFHVATRPFKNIEDRDQDKTSWVGEGLYANPRGVWISCGLAWQKYIGNTPHQWSFATYIYEVIPSDTILKISSVKELERFIDDYKNNKQDIKIHDIIDWDLVKEDYDGLIICPYLGDLIWGKDANKFGMWGDKKQLEYYIQKVVGNKWRNSTFFLAEWYRHWEAASGVIWKKEGIASIRLIKKLDTYDNIVP